MFSSIIAIFKTAFQLFQEGLKKILGTGADEPDATVLVSKVAAVVIAAVALVIFVLPFPQLRTWSDTLFRVSYQLWTTNQFPGRTA